MKKDDLMFLKHMFQSIQKIETYLKGVDFEGLVSNELLISGVTREMEIIGEASNNLNSKFKQEHLEIPLQKIKDMRNFLAHQYFEIDLKLIWKTYKENLPELKKLIKPLIK